MYISGCAKYLQCDNGREFSNQIIQELLIMWPRLKMVHGKPRHSWSHGSVKRANQDVQNILKSWMKEMKNSRWSEGLRFFQFQKLILTTMESSEHHTRLFLDEKSEVVYDQPSSLQIFSCTNKAIKLYKMRFVWVYLDKMPFFWTNIETRKILLIFDIWYMA